MENQDHQMLELREQGCRLGLTALAVDNSKIEAPEPSLVPLREVAGSVLAYYRSYVSSARLRAVILV